METSRKVIPVTQLKLDWTSHGILLWKDILDSEILYLLVYPHSPRRFLG